MNTVINSPGDVISLVGNLYRNMEQEMLLLVTLSSASTVIGIYPLSLGTDCECLISPKMIARRAVLDLARGVIIMHNHPSGNCNPSCADIKQTAKVKEALNLFEIDLMDHIIICPTTYYSFSEEKSFPITDNSTTAHHGKI